MIRPQKTFRAIEAGDGDDGRWAVQAPALARAAEGRVSEEGRSPEGAAGARELFERHLPELVPALDRLAGQLDPPWGDTLRTFAAPRPFFSSRTRTGAAGALVRNYDFRPDECEGSLVSS